MTTTKARVILLKKFRQSKYIEKINENNVVVKKIQTRKSVKFETYKICDKNYSNLC